MPEGGQVFPNESKGQMPLTPLISLAASSLRLGVTPVTTVDIAQISLLSRYYGLRFPGLAVFFILLLSPPLILELSFLSLPLHLQLLLPSIGSVL